MDIDSVIRAAITERADPEGAEAAAPGGSRGAERVRHARETWPRFRELEPQIAALMRSHPDLDLEEAYRAALAEERLQRLSITLAESRQNGATPQTGTEPTADVDAVIHQALRG